MPKRLSKSETHIMGDEKGRLLMCHLGVKNAKKVAHRMWKYLQREEKRQKEMK